VLHTASAAVDALITPDQVYVTLWSHAGGAPCAPTSTGHLHWVVQPITHGLMASFDELRGPHLQAAMFDRNEQPSVIEVEAMAGRFREWFARHAPELTGEWRNVRGRPRPWLWR
jgi:hypothetical protein